MSGSMLETAIAHSLAANDDARGTSTYSLGLSVLSTTASAQSSSPLCVCPCAPSPVSAPCAVGVRTPGVSAIASSSKNGQQTGACISR